MMTHRKLAVAVSCLAVVCVTSILWPAYKKQEAQRQLAESARQYRTRAESGDADAQYRLGSVYYYGKGAPQDYTGAVRWFRMSADQGDTQAQCGLAASYGQGLGVSKSPAEAIRWSQRAAGQGSATGRNGLGFMYERGEGVPQNFAAAAHWYRKAAEQGDVTAQFYLGRAYRWGRGVPQSYADAAGWYRKAAEQGDMAAQWYLGRAYGSGQGVPQSSIESARWRLKVFKQVGLRCIRRNGWTPWVAIALFLASFVVSSHSEWLSSALIAGGGAAGALHVLSGTSCRGWGRVLFFAFLTMVAVAYTYVAVMTAVRSNNPGVDPGQPSAMP